MTFTRDEARETIAIIREIGWEELAQPPPEQRLMMRIWRIRGLPKLGSEKNNQKDLRRGK
jgi:hypothetical protein